MPAQKLYELAEEYRKTELWTRRNEAGVFAVAYPDGEIGYCVTAGKNSDLRSLAIYMGEYELGLLERFAHETENTIPLIHCLMCSFPAASEMDAGERERIASFGINFSAEYPLFRRHEVRRFPRPLQDEEEIERMEYALMAALALAEILEKGEDARSLGIAGDEILMLEWKEDHFSCSTIPYPDVDFCPYEYAPPPDDISRARMRFAGKNPGASIICDISILGDVVNGNPPFYPMMMLMMDQNGILQDMCHTDELGSSAPLARALVEYIVENGMPDVLVACNRLTLEYFAEFCEEIGLPIELLKEEYG